MKKLAKEKGGKCISDKYINAHTKLLWQCRLGHQWEAKPHNVQTGSWCPVCAKEYKNKYLRLTIEEMQQIAKERGGKCLSDSYVNSMTKLLWECSEGHQWEARPGDVKNGKTWCPECHKNKKIQKGSQAQLQFF